MADHPVVAALRRELADIRGMLGGGPKSWFSGLNY